MQVAEKKNEGLKREYSVTIPAGDIARQVELKLVEVGKTARLPGFRPGKAPLDLMRQRYGQSVTGEVLEQSINSSNRALMNERGLRPAMQPRVEVTSFNEGQDLVYTVNFEILPEIVPCDFKTVSVERLVVTPTDDEVLKAVQGLADMRKPLNKVADGRPARLGDTLVIDFDGTVDGKRRDGMKAEGFRLELGSKSFVGTFEEQLVGCRAGEEKVVKVTFPDDYGAADLQGVAAEFAVKVHELHEPGELKLDDEFAKGFGLESLDKLKEQVRLSLDERYRHAARLKAKRMLLDVLADRHDFAVPEGMVEFEFRTIWKQREQQGPDPEEKGSTDEEIKAEYRNIAERRVRLGLLLAEIGQKHNIQVSEEDLRRALIERVREYPGQEQAVFDYYTKTPEALNALRAPLFEDKVVDFLFELVNLQEKPGTAADLREDSDSEKGSGE